MAELEHDYCGALDSKLVLFDLARATQPLVVFLINAAVILVIQKLGKRQGLALHEESSLAQFRLMTAMEILNIAAFLVISRQPTSLANIREALFSAGYWADKGSSFSVVILQYIIISCVLSNGYFFFDCLFLLLRRLFGQGLVCRVKVGQMFTMQEEKPQFVMGSSKQLSHLYQGY